MNNKPAMTSPEQSSFTLLYYAAERTLMSWIHTALGMMALGFVIDRFGLVLGMLPKLDNTLSPTSYSFWTGSALVFGGAVMAFTAALRYIGLERHFRRESYLEPGNGLPLGVLYSLLVGFLGVAIGLILATVRY